MTAVVALPATGAAQSTWTVDPKPIFDVAGAAPGGQINFALPAGATRLTDGSVLVADRGASAIVLFDRAGKLLKTTGRAGEGPGEFQTMVWAGGCGADSMLVWDARLRRATFIAKNGVIARQVRVGAETSTPGALWFSCGSGGAIAYLSEPSGRRPSPSANIMLMRANVVSIGRDGAMVTDHGQVSGGEWFSLGRGGFPRPLGATTSIAMVGRSLVIGTGDSASVLVIAPDGRRRTVPIAGQRRAPTRDEFDAAVESIGSIAPAPVRQAAIEGLSAAPMPELLPPYAAVFGDPLELLWVQVSPSGAKTGDFVVMQLDGRVVARVRLPRALTVYEIGRDYVLGAYTDENAEMHVAAYRLVR